MKEDNIFDVEFQKTQKKLEKLTDCLSPSMQACVVAEQQYAKSRAFCKWLAVALLVGCVELTLGLVYFQCLFIFSGLRIAVACAFVAVLFVFLVLSWFFYRSVLKNLATKSYPVMLEFAMSLLDEKDIVPDTRFDSDDDE